ncbi:four helix bundle protein, partial [Psychroserpens sp.]
TASASEFRSMQYLTVRLNFSEKEIADKLISNSNEISRMLYGLIKSLK